VKKKPFYKEVPVKTTPRKATSPREMALLQTAADLRKELYNLQEMRKTEHTVSTGLTQERDRLRKQLDNQEQWKTQTSLQQDLHNQTELAKSKELLIRELREEIVHLKMELWKKQAYVPPPLVHDPNVWPQLQQIATKEETTYRDATAQRAMTALLNADVDRDSTYTQLAKEAYLLADCMLLARGERRDGQ